MFLRVGCIWEGWSCDDIGLGDEFLKTLEISAEHCVVKLADLSEIHWIKMEKVHFLYHGQTAFDYAVEGFTFGFVEMLGEFFYKHNLVIFGRNSLELMCVEKRGFHPHPPQLILDAQTNRILMVFELDFVQGLVIVEAGVEEDGGVGIGEMFVELVDWFGGR